MIERLVLLELIEEESTEAGRREVAERSLEVLAALPGVVGVEVGVAMDEPTAASWDVMLRVRFASAGDIEAYRLHPDHRRYVDGYLTPRLAAIRAFNFELTGDGSRRRDG